MDILCVCDTDIIFLAEANDTKEEQLIQALLHETIVCVEAALFYYRYSNFVPRIWTFTIPHTMSKTKLNMDSILYKPYYIQNKLY